MLHATKFRIYAGMRLAMLSASFITFAHGASAQQANGATAVSEFESRAKAMISEIRGGGRIASLPHGVVEIVSGWSRPFENSNISRSDTAPNDFESATFFLELTLKSASSTTRCLWFITEPMFAR